jgi:hypothetical protein
LYPLPVERERIEIKIAGTHPSYAAVVHTVASLNLENIFDQLKEEFFILKDYLLNQIEEVTKNALWESNSAVLIEDRFRFKVCADLIAPETLRVLINKARQRACNSREMTDYLVILAHEFQSLRENLPGELNFL